MADLAEVQRTKAKMDKEVSAWVRFTTDLESYNRVSLGLQAEFLDKGRADQRAAVEAWQESTYPVRDLSELPHAITFAQACGNRKFSDATGRVCKVFWLNTSTLGYDAVQGSMEALQDVAGLMSADPERSCLLVAAPTVGAFGSEYDEVSIEESANKIKQKLCNPDLRLLCRDVYLQFDPTSLPQQCKRPGVHKFFMAISDQAKEGTLLSGFASSILWRRQTVPNACNGKVLLVPMMLHRNMIDSRRDFSTAGANQTLSRPSRRRQWIAGWQVPAAFHDSLWQGTAFDKASMAVWVDLFAYDHSLAECLMRRAKDALWPQQMYVGTVWAAMGARHPGQKGDAAHSQEADCARVAKWLQTQIRRKLHMLASEGATMVPEWKALPNYSDKRSAPQLDTNDFTVLYPAAAKNLPLRAAVLEAMESRVQSPDAKSMWQGIVKEHNAAWNPSGQAWDNKRKSDGSSEATAAKKPRLVEAVAGKPASLEELEALCGKCVTIQLPAVADLHLYIPTEKGGIWAFAEADVCVTDLSNPVALVFGQFKVGEANHFSTNNFFIL